MVEFASMLNKPLKSVALDEGKTEIAFLFEDGSSRKFGVAGDCCSHSWIEHLETPDSIPGAIITAVEERGGVPWDGHECKQKATGWGHECGHESLVVYNTRFRTNKGDIVLEYRNDSNGYYGGYLVDAN